MFNLLTYIGHFLFINIISLTAIAAFGASESECGDALNKPASNHESTLARQYYEDWYAAHGNLYYKSEWERLANKYSAKFLIEDKISGRQEVLMLERLGFVISSSGIKAPTFDTFLKNYIAVLDEKKVPEKNRIVPALTFQKKEQSGKKMNYLFVTPHLEPFPNSREWKPVSPQIKNKSLVRAIANGKLTCFYKGLHDVYHFVTFALHPEGMAAVRHIHEMLAKTENNRSLWRRAVYMLETLSLGDPKKKEELRKFLLFPGVRNSVKGKLTIENFLTFFNSISKEDLMKHAEKMQHHFTDFILSYAGGIADRYERDIYRSRYKMAQYQSIELFMGIPTYVNLDSMILPDRSIYESFIYLVDHLDNILNLVGQPIESQELALRSYNKQISINTGNPSNIRVEDLLRIALARMEFMLWRTATDLTIEQWVSDLSEPNLDLESPTITFLKDTMGESSIIYRFLTGEI